MSEGKSNGDVDREDVRRVASALIAAYGRVSGDEAVARARALEVASAVPHFAAAVRAEVERICLEKRQPSRL